MGSSPIRPTKSRDGGAWISGDKQNITQYARNLAVEGFTVVAVNYTVAPEAVYLTALNQLNSALGYLADNADRLRIDPDRMVLAGAFASRCGPTLAKGLV